MGEAKRYQSCPFCGATPHHGLGKVYHGQLHGEPLQDFSIKCPHGHAKVTRPSEELARAEWNTRAPAQDARRPDAEAVLDGIGEALESRGYAHMTNGRDIGLLLDMIPAALRAPEAADAGAVAALQAEVDRLTKRLDLLAVGFDVPDGGRYIADWQTRIDKYKQLSASPADAGMRERAAKTACDGCQNTGWCHANDKCYLNGTTLPSTDLKSGGQRS